MSYLIATNVLAKNNRNLFSHCFGDWKSEIKVSAEPCTLKGSKEGYFLPVPASGGHWYPWAVVASLQPLPPSSRGLLPCLCVCLLIRTLTLNLGPTLMQYNPFSILTLSISARPYFQIRSHSKFPGRREFWGRVVNPLHPP